MTEEFLKDPALQDYIIRPPELSDAEAAATLHNICSMLVSGKNEVEPSNFESGWQSPDFNKEASVRLVFTRDGQLVGNFSLRDHQAPYVQIGLNATIHPDHRDSGMAAVMLKWAEARAMEAVPKAPEGAQVILRSGADQEDTYKNELLRSFGMEVNRHFYEMQIEFDKPPGVPAVLEGIEIRPFDRETELIGVALTYQDSFKDHFGFVEEPIEKLMEGVNHMIETDPHYDPEFWFVAMDGDEMAGISLCSPKTIEDPEMGFIDVLGVRRPWRGRGLGLALLQHSFVKMVENGSKRAGLGVDASSLTGATRLYEKAGMSVARQYNAYRKILRDGKDITTTEI